MFDALNKGMALATGDIIGVLHSDDVFDSHDIIDIIVKTFQEKDIDTLYGDLEYVYSEDIDKLYRRWNGKEYNRNLFKLGWMPAHPAFYFKRALLEKYGNYETHYFSAADYEFMARYLFKFKLSSYYLPKLIVKMRRGGLSNRNIFQRLRANRRDYLAMKANGIPFAFFVSFLKPLSKLHQYYKK
jgi:glycosyltransferase